MTIFLCLLSFLAMSAHAAQGPQFKGTYWLQSDNGGKTLASFPVEVQLVANTAESVTIRYQLPAELTGQESPVTATIWKDKRIKGSKVRGKCEDALLFTTCQVKYSGHLVQNQQQLVGLIRSKHAPAEFEERLAIAKRFNANPTGFLSITGELAAPQKPAKP